MYKLLNYYEKEMFNRIMDELENANDVIEGLDDEIKEALLAKFEGESLLINSSEFKESVIDWMYDCPQELLALNMLSNDNNVENTLLSYGSMIVGGAYYDFCKSFESLMQESEVLLSKKYSIEDNNTGERIVVSLERVIGHYKKIYTEKRSFNKNIEIDFDGRIVKYNVIKADEVCDKKGDVLYGKLYYNSYAVREINKIINSAFTIKELKESRPIESQNSNNVVRLHKKSSKKII